MHENKINRQKINYKQTAKSLSFYLKLQNLFLLLLQELFQLIRIKKNLKLPDSEVYNKKNINDF